MELSESVQDQVQAARQVSFPAARRLLAEALGTFALTFVAAGGVVIAALSHGGLVMEIILIFFLVTVILATAANDKVVGHNAALAVSATIALDGLFAAPISGASMNSARSLGPALVDQQLGNIWIYLVGPTAGAVVAVAVGWLLRGSTNQAAKTAASGDG